MQLVFLSKPARSFMGNKDQVGVFHLKGWLKVKSGGRYQEGRGMYKSSATRSVDETRVVEGLGLGDVHHRCSELQHTSRQHHSE